MIRHKKNVIGFFEVSATDVVVKPELKAYGYPTRSSRHKADTKYLLFSLEQSGLPMRDIDFNSFTPIMGKGVSI